METTLHGINESILTSAKDGDVLDVEKLVTLENTMEDKLVEAYNGRFKKKEKQAPLCTVCGKPVPMIVSDRTYRKTCSDECLKERRHQHAQKHKWHLGMGKP